MLIKIFCIMVKGYRRMSYLVLSQMESITAKRFKLLIRAERKGSISKKSMKSICMKMRKVFV